MTPALKTSVREVKEDFLTPSYMALFQNEHLTLILQHNVTFKIMCLLLSPTKVADGWCYLILKPLLRQDSLDFGSGSWLFPILNSINRHTLLNQALIKRNMSHLVLLHHPLAFESGLKSTVFDTPSYRQTDRHMRGRGQILHKTRDVSLHFSQCWITDFSFHQAVKNLSSFSLSEIAL